MKMFQTSTVIVFLLLIIILKLPFVSARVGRDSVKYARTGSSPILTPPDHYTLLAHFVNAFLNTHNGIGRHRAIFANTLIEGVDDPYRNKIFQEDSGDRA